jgi:hypothetical protein
LHRKFVPNCALDLRNVSLDSAIPGIKLDKNHEDVRYDGWPQIMLYALRILGAVLVFVALSYLQKTLLG